MLTVQSRVVLILVAAVLAIPGAAAGTNLVATPDSQGIPDQRSIALDTNGNGAPFLQVVVDTDGDGCSDQQELAPASQASLGGGRDPNNFWDVFAVWTQSPPQRMASVSVLDIAGVVFRFGSSPETPPSEDQVVAEEQALIEALVQPADILGYHAAFDRGGTMPGQSVRNLLPPDGNINIGDIGAVIAQFGLSCVSTQRPIVLDYIQQSQLVRISCLDVNDDGRINTQDADPKALPDITGDGDVNDADLAVIQGTDISLPAGKPEACADSQPKPGWQVTPPAVVDCAAGESAVIILGVSGGGFDPVRGLDDAGIAVGVRWMEVNIRAALESQGIPVQLTSVTPGIDGAEQPVFDAEAWASTYLAAELARTPCLNAVLIGHSNGGMLVKAVAATLEEAGLGDRILLTILIDLMPGFYQGTVDAMPQVSSVFNIYQTNDTFFPPWHPIDQPNVENWDASGEIAPEFGDHGGTLIPVVHSNIANSQGVSDRVTDESVDEACTTGLC